MSNKLKKLKENKILNMIYNIGYTLLAVLVIAIFIVVVLQRVSNNTFSIGGFKIFNILTGSMLPKYEVGDILVSKDIEPNEIQIGDDIVYLGKSGTFAGKTVTHQVIDIEEENGAYKFHTKGIANQEEDPLVSQEQVIGKIVYKIQSLSFISKLINNLYSFYFIIFIPVAILIFLEIKRLVIDVRETKEEKGEDSKEDDESDK